jgi:hypothetical protein
MGMMGTVWADYVSIPGRRLRILVSVFADFSLFSKKTVTSRKPAASYEYEGSTLGVAPT